MAIAMLNIPDADHFVSALPCTMTNRAMGEGQGKLLRPGGKQRHV